MFFVLENIYISTECLSQSFRDFTLFMKGSYEPKKFFEKDESQNVLKHCALEGSIKIKL